MARQNAFLIGGGLGTLGALRLLHRAGISSMCYGPPGIEKHSRWYEAAPGSTNRQVSSAHLSSYLSDCKVDGAPLIPCSDAAVRAIGDLPPDLHARFPASVPSRRSINALTDKGEFSSLLQRLELDMPLTLHVKSLKDLVGLPASVFENAFLKPRDSQSFCAAFGAKAFRTSCRDEAMARLARPLELGQHMLLQEYIPGPGSNHMLIDGFADRNGSIRAMLARRRERMFPLDFGNSSAMVSIPLADVPGPVAALRRIIEDLGYRGIFSAEFKLDERDGRFKLIEINARVWWFVEFTGRCGVDVATMSYLDAIGEPVPEVRSYRTGVRMVHPYYDFFAARAAARTGPASLTSILATWIGAQQPHFNWLDPAPAVADLLEHLPIHPHGRTTPLPSDKRV